MDTEKNMRIAQLLLQPPDAPIPYHQLLGQGRLKEAATGYSALGNVPSGPLAVSPLRWLGTILGQLDKIPPDQVEARMRQQMEQAQGISDVVPRGY